MYVRFSGLYLLALQSLFLFFLVASFDGLVHATDCAGEFGLNQSLNCYSHTYKLLSTGQMTRLAGTPAVHLF